MKNCKLKSLLIIISLIPLVSSAGTIFYFTCPTATYLNKIANYSHDQYGYYINWDAHIHTKPSRANMKLKTLNIPFSGMASIDKTQENKPYIKSLKRIKLMGQAVSCIYTTTSGKEISLSNFGSINLPSALKSPNGTCKTTPQQCSSNQAINCKIYFCN